MKDTVLVLKDTNNDRAHANLKKMLKESSESDMHYERFDDFFGLLMDENSYVRVRGFEMVCAQAKWDREGKIGNVLPEMLTLLDDEKPTVVRQCLSALIGVIRSLPELSGRIKTYVRAIDTSKFSDSMAPLIGLDKDKVLRA